MAKENFLKSPYYDDYDENKKFYKILFRPSIPVQARELTQIQSILQKQVERLGTHFFKEGDKVVDGQLYIENNVRYIKLETSDDVTAFIGKELIGGTSKAVGLVVTASNYEDSSNPSTLYVKFISSGEGTNTQEFIKGETLAVKDSDVTYDLQIQSGEDAIGDASIARVNRGVYFIYGNFVLVDEQVLILSKYSNMPTCKVGFTVVESIVTPEQDSSLYDNAIGSYNESAPGAHRYCIECILSKRSISAESSNDFIELVNTVNGQINKINSTNESNTITEDVLARRTYDESGDYVVRQFKSDVREHRSNDRGTYSSGNSYIRGDIVRYNDATYRCLISGTLSSPTSSTDWEKTDSPTINNGVYNAMGRVTGVTILQTRYYTSNPDIKITQGDSSASAVGFLDESGKLIDIEVIDSDDTFNGVSSISVTVNGDSTVASAITNIGYSNEFALMLNSGKAYVKGYEIEKVGSTILSIPKARTTESVKNALVSYTNGNYVYVTDVNFVPKFKSDVIFNLYDRFIEYSTYPTAVSKGPSSSESPQPIGTCRIRGFVKDSVTGYYKLYFSDVNVSQKYSFERDVKCIGIGGSVKGNFFANIVKDQNLTKLSGTVTCSGTTVSGTNTNFTDSAEIKVGDYITFGSTNFARVTAISTQNTLTIDRSITLSTASNIYRIGASRIDPQNFSNIYKITNNTIASVTDFDFTVLYYLSTADVENTVKYDSSTNKTIITFIQPFEYGEFSSYPSQYILSNSVKGIITDFTIEFEGKNCVIKVTGNVSGEYRLCATIRVHNNSTEGETIDKICQKKVITATTETFNTPKETLLLSNYDVFQVTSIKMSDGSNSDDPYTIDVTERYTLDNGQRDAYYDTPKLTLNKNYSVPTNAVRVSYKYFNQNKPSGLIGFVVNSYVNSANKKIYEDVPSYDGNSLISYIDFRQRQGDSSSYPVMLKDDEEIEISYSYYLPRKDRICLDSKGNFVDVQGVPSLNPQYPEIPSMAMNLYNVTVYPYVFDVVTDVEIAIVDNKRYTMRDIGKLETRVKNLEDYTTLSLLEQQTTSMSITDSNGLDRFKQGFVVDNFRNTDVISSSDENVNCSMDSTESLLRPSYVTRNVSMSEYLKRDSGGTYSRDDKNYMAYGKVYTLPLDENEPHTVLVSQPIGTRTENINPFAVVRFLGSMSVNPSSDDWYETQYIDAGITNIEGNYEKTFDALNGTIQWDAWEQSWAGVINTLSSKTATTSSSDWVLTKYGQRIENGSHDYRYDTYTRTNTNTTTTVYGQNVGYSRTGLKSLVYEQIDYEEVGDYLVSTTNLPYMRSRNLLVKVKGLKPNTIFYPFFDNVDVSMWCTPATVIQYIPQNTVEFDTTSLSVTANSEDARSIESSLKSLWAETTDKTCLDVGDVITGSSSKTTAIVVGKSVDVSDVTTPKYYLYVLNIKGKNRFIVPTNSTSNDGETFTGSISGAIGKIVSISGHTLKDGESSYGNEQNKQHGDDLISNRNGELQFIYWIPDADKLIHSSLMSNGVSGYLKFKCGDRILAVNDNKINENTVSNSRAETTYSATGVLNTRQKQINAVRNAKIVTESVSDSKTVYNSWSQTTTSKSTQSKLAYVYLDPLAQTFLVECEGGCFLSKVDIYFATKDENIPVTLEIRTVNNGYPSGEVLAFGTCTLTPDKVNLSSTSVTYLDENGESVSMRNFDTPTTFEFESPVYVEDGQQYAIVLKSDSVNYRVWIAQIGDTVPNQDYIVSDQPSLGVLFKSQNASTWSAEQNQDLMFTIYRANFKKGVRANITFKSNELTPTYIGSNPFATTEGSNVVTVWHSNHGFVTNDKVKFTTNDPNIINRNNIITGTITVVKDNATVTGTNTLFDVDVQIGDAIYYYNGGTKTFIGFVKSVTSSTELTLMSAPSTSYTSVQAWVEVGINGIKPTDIFDKEFYVSNVHYNHYDITITDEKNDAIEANATGFAGGSYVMATNNIKYDIIRPNITSQTFSDTGITYTLQDETTPLVINANNEFVEPKTIKSPLNLETDANDALIVHATFITDNQALSPIVDSDRISAILVSNVIDTDTTQEPIAQYITKDIALSETANYLRITFEALVSSDSNLAADKKVKVYYKTFLKSATDSDSIEWVELNPTDSINSSYDYQDISYSTGDLESFDTFKVKIVMQSANTSNPPKIRSLRMVACL